MRAGIGSSTAETAAVAGREAAEEALSRAAEPVLTFLFSTEQYDQQVLLETVRDCVGSGRIVGACMGGVITSRGVLEHGVGVCVISGDELEVVTTLQEGGTCEPGEMGRRAAEELLAGNPQGGTVFVLPDGFGANIAKALRSLYNAMGPDFAYTGGGTGDNLHFARSYQFTEKGVASGGLAAALLRGVHIKTGIGHGWKPIGDPLVITRAENKTVLEIDGLPAFTAYSKRLGDIPREEFPAFGMRHPLGFPDISGNYLIRDPITVNEDDSIGFVTEIPGNAVGSLMRGEVPVLIETARRAVCDVVDALVQPDLVLLFDCISRYLLMEEDFQKELSVIASAIGRDVPVLGALTFGEVGSYEDVPLLHNKTLTLAAAGNLKGRQARHAGE
jgi:hypothetical protein